MLTTQNNIPRSSWKHDFKRLLFGIGSGSGIPPSAPVQSTHIHEKNPPLEKKHPLLFSLLAKWDTKWSALVTPPLFLILWNQCVFPHAYWLILSSFGPTSAILSCQPPLPGYFRSRIWTKNTFFILKKNPAVLVAVGIEMELQYRLAAQPPL